MGETRQAPPRLTPMEVASVVNKNFTRGGARQQFKIDGRVVPKNVTLLGSGHYGDVFRIITRCNTTYAVKVILVEKLREYDILQRLNSVRQILHVYGSCTFGKRDEYAMILMEYCDGSTLTDYDESLSERAVLQITRDILAALIACQEVDEYHAIFHGDLHLENIMICRGQTKIIDWGDAKLVSRGPSFKLYVEKDHYALARVILLLLTSGVDIPRVYNRHELLQIIGQQQISARMTTLLRGIAEGKRGFEYSPDVQEQVLRLLEAQPEE